MQIAPAELERSLYSVKPGFGAEEALARIAWLGAVNGEWYVCRAGGIAVGWAVVTWSGKATHPEYPDISDLYVREELRGRGIGTALLHFVEAEAARRGYHRIGLAVNPTLNPRAHSLYLRLGYVHDGGPAYLDGIYDGIENWVIDLEKKIGLSPSGERRLRA